MTEVRKFKGTGRDERVMLVFSDWESLAGNIPEMSGRFACVVAADAAGMSGELISAALVNLMRKGCRYIVCWGADCKRVRDLWDENATRVATTEKEIIDPEIERFPSSSHAKKPLEDALWFALNCTDKVGNVEIKHLLVLCQSRENWPAQVTHALTDPDTFSDEVMDRKYPNLEE